MIDEETPLGFAIRQDPGISLDDGVLFGLLAPAMRSDADPGDLLSAPGLRPASTLTWP